MRHSGSCRRRRHFTRDRLQHGEPLFALAADLNTFYRRTELMAGAFCAMLAFTTCWRMKFFRPIV